MQYTIRDLHEAANIVAQRENIDFHYALEHYAPRELFKKVRKYYAEREARMDAIRATW